MKLDLTTMRDVAMEWKKWFAAIAILMVAAIILAWLFYFSVKRVAVPHAIKLGDFTNGIVNLHLDVPKGHGFRLDLNASDSQPSANGYVKSSYTFFGRICISNGASLIAAFPVSSDKAWSVGPDFVLTGTGGNSTNVPPLGDFIQAGKAYDIGITLNPPPPPSSSIWFYWLQSRSDLGK